MEDESLKEAYESLLEDHLKLVEKFEEADHILETICGCNASTHWSKYKEENNGL